MQNRVLKFAFMLALSWCVMTFTHELGHLLGGWMGGGTLQQADLLPWHLPYSIFNPDPHPLITLWCGPLIGVVLLQVTAMLVRRGFVYFIAHFCTLANGLYLATAWVSGDQYLDTPRLLEQGVHPATIAMYCVLTIGAGYVGFRRQCLAVFFQASDHAASAKNQAAA